MQHTGLGFTVRYEIYKFVTEPNNPSDIFHCAYINGKILA